MLHQAGQYVQYKSTKILMKAILDFVDSRAEEVLRLPEFKTLPQHVVRLILSRDDLAVSKQKCAAMTIVEHLVTILNVFAKAMESVKFKAALEWGRHYVQDHKDCALAETIAPLIGGWNIFDLFMPQPTRLMLRFHDRVHFLPQDDGSRAYA